MFPRSHAFRSRFLALTRLVAVAIGFSLSNAAIAGAAISFVQVNAALPQTPQTTVTVVYAAAQVAGDANVVVIGWNDSTSHVLSVTDTRGNLYTPAVGPTVQSGIQQQVIYVAQNVAAAAAGANTVTVQFDTAVSYPDVRAAAYRGVDAVNPVDRVAGAVGTSATSSSGSVTTTSANDLIVGANYVQTSTRTVGSGYTSRVITAPDGNILEDRQAATKFVREL